MRGYWLKIVLGAAVIALVGTGAVRLVQSGIEKGHQVVETAEPITIPLAFVPFNLAGQRVGSLKRLRILRDAPESVTGFQIRVEVGDLPIYEQLSSGCVLSVDNPTNLSTATNFECVAPDSTRVEFGTVEVLLAEGSTSRMVVPLYLPAAVVAEFRGGRSDAGEVTGAMINADSMARSMRRMADSIRVQTRELADSIRRSAAARVPPQ
jgi:hypothetical protein